MVSILICFQNLSEMQNHRDNIRLKPMMVFQHSTELSTNLYKMLVNFKEFELLDFDSDASALAKQHKELKRRAKSNLASIQHNYLGDESDIERLSKTFEKIALIEEHYSNYINNQKVISGEARGFLLGNAWHNEVLENLEVINKNTNVAVRNLDVKTQQAILQLKENIIIISSLALLVTFLFTLFLNRKSTRFTHYLNGKLSLIDNNIPLVKLNQNFEVIRSSKAMKNIMKKVDGKFANLYSPIPIRDVFSIHEVKASINKNGSFRKQVQCEIAGLHLMYNIIPVKENGLDVEYINIVENISDRINSTTDALTGLLNRRAFEIRASELLEQDCHAFITVAIIDVDHFKQYNDLYGHPQGDTCLQLIANELKNSFRRSSDAVYRIGGEEFAVVTISQAPQKSEKLLNDVKERIESLHLVHEGNSVSEFVTISIGGYIHQQGKQLELNDAYRIADHLLYKAKQTRNSVVCDASYVEEWEWDKIDAVCSNKSKTALTS